MDIKFIKPFYENTVKVFKTMIATDVKPGTPFLKIEDTSLGDISAVVTMTGDTLSGTFVLNFHETVFIAFVNRMLGESHTKVTPEIIDAAAEIANMIYGNAKNELEIAKICKFEKAIPTVVSGKGHKINYKRGDSKIFVVPFESDLGIFNLELCTTKSI